MLANASSARDARRRDRHARGSDRHRTAHVYRRDAADDDDRRRRASPNATSLTLVTAIGITGPALATLLEVAVAGLVLPNFACRAMSARYRDYARASLAPMAPAFVLVATLGLTVRTLANPGSVFSGISALALELVSFLAVIASMGGARRARYARALSLRF
jgi:hypothetical protein